MYFNDKFPSLVSSPKEIHTQMQTTDDMNSIHAGADNASGDRCKDETSTQADSEAQGIIP